MSATDSTLFTLNEVASLIWKSADGATPLWEIVKSRFVQNSMLIPRLPWPTRNALSVSRDRGLLLLTTTRQDFSVKAERGL